MQSAAGNIETAKIRLGRATSDFARYENHKSRTITKQQYEQALATNKKQKSQVRILQQQEKATAFQTSVIKAKRI
jgi:membrane fusion protein (multidrug efflux system)